MDGQTGGFASDVPERHLDRAHRAAPRLERAPVADVQHDPLHLDRVFADDVRLVVQDVRLQVRLVGLDRRVAAQALVGDDPNYGGIPDGGALQVSNSHSGGGPNVAGCRGDALANGDLATRARGLLGSQKDLDDVAAPGWGDLQLLGAVDGADQVLQLLGEGLQALDFDGLVGPTLVDGELIRVRVELEHAVGAGDFDLALVDPAGLIASVDNGRVQPVAQL